jgi:hypothetical protein
MDWLEPFSTKMTETADEHFPAPPPPHISVQNFDPGLCTFGGAGLRFFW